MCKWTTEMCDYEKTKQMLNYCWLSYKMNVTSHKLLNAHPVIVMIKPSKFSLFFTNLKDGEGRGVQPRQRKI